MDGFSLLETVCADDREQLIRNSWSSKSSQTRPVVTRCKKARMGLEWIDKKILGIIYYRLYL